MNEPKLNRYLTLAYEEARTQQPGVGRRQLKQSIINRFWGLSKAEKIGAIQNASIAPPADSLSFETDTDPYDIPGLTNSSVVGTRGIVVRTYFDQVDETAWATFLSSLEDLERRSLGSVVDSQMDESSESESEGEQDDKEQEGESNAPVQDETQITDAAEKGQHLTTTLTYEADAIFVVVDPTKQERGEVLQGLLAGASNIALLRLFNDALVAPAPGLPANSPKRIKPGHRLIDEDGFQEVYVGPRVWVWDQQSAKDQTLRLVSSRVFVYGDATADSWRVKAAHMWDLQVNIDAGMRIDFSGGTGVGWNVYERERNLKDALI
ncbi:hypothetical protein FRC12_007076 [Ceratobasidium sp. 428]|nr:hypothetical protein FRC12_007076 [Ceratobasidium sp. 428]